jgi:argininosuccinate lyase
MNVEARLTEIVGEAGKRLHTGAQPQRSGGGGFPALGARPVRCGDRRADRADAAFVAQAEAGADWVMPGFTHLQTAQPVTWGHHMMAYVEMFARDRSRFADARARMNECPWAPPRWPAPGLPSTGT